MVKITNLVKRYKENLAVDNLSLHIPEGKVIGLLGPNGAGKTTTIHSIMGLVGYNSGEIKVFDKDFSKHSAEIKREIGFVPQFVAVYSDLTSAENLAFFGKLYGLKGKHLKDRIDEVLDIIGLSDVRDKQTKDFSGGMLRRINIGCALIHNPKLLIMDEPTVGIDAQSRNEILKTIKELNKKGMTIIYTSHYMHEVEYLCDEVIIMDEGRVIANGDLKSLSSYISHDHVLSVSFREGDVLDIEPFKTIKGVKGIEKNDMSYKIIYSPKSASKREILGQIMDTGLEINEIKDSTPTLEDVFLTMTGKSLEG